MTNSTQKPRINLAAPSKEQKVQLAAMPELERRKLIESEIMRGFEGYTRKVTPENTKTRILKKLAANV